MSLGRSKLVPSVSSTPTNLHCRDRMDRKRKKELKKLREQLAEQQQLMANQNLLQQVPQRETTDDGRLKIPLFCDNSVNSHSGVI